MTHLRVALKSLRMVAFWIAVITFVVFIPALRNGFVSWDDGTNLVANPNFRGFSWPNLKWMWTNHLLSHYVPLTWMTFGLDYVIWGRNSLGYHLTNVVLHALNAGLFYLLSLALFQRPNAGKTPFHAGRAVAGAAFAALLFSLHPLRVESVAWVTERRDVLSGFFFLLALLEYLRAVDADRVRFVRNYTASFVFFILAVLSKEIGVVLPAVLLLLDVYPLRRLSLNPLEWLSGSSRLVVLEKVPFFAASAAFSLMTLEVGMKNHLLPSASTLGWDERIAITAYALAFYLLKTLIPVNLAPLYALAPRNMSFSLPVIVASAVILSIAAAAILLRRRFPGLLIVLLIYIITLLPVSGILQNGAQVAADRYTYLACLGWSLLAGLAFASLLGALDSRPARALAVSAALAVFLFLSWLTQSQIRVWLNSETLWSRAVAVAPSSIAYENLASARFSEGDAVGAIELYRRAIGMSPRDAVAHVGLGTALLDLRRWDEATRELRLAAELGPKLPLAYSGLGHALMMQGKLDEAIVQLQRAVQLKPEDQDLHVKLERALALRQNQKQGPVLDPPARPHEP